MKNKLHVFLCIMALSVLPLWAGDDSKPTTIEQRLRETDVSLALQQYERVKMELFDASLKLELLVTDGDLTESARLKQAGLLQKKCEILQRHADELLGQLRELAMQRGEETAVAKAK